MLEEIKHTVVEEGPFGKTIVFQENISLKAGDELVIKHDGNCDVEAVFVRRKEVIAEHGIFAPPDSPFRNGTLFARTEYKRTTEGEPITLTWLRKPNGRVYYSEDDGKTWKEVDDFLSTEG